MKNEYEIRGDITAIFLKRKDGTIMETIISTSDLERVKEFPYTWNAGLYQNNKRFYVIGNTEYVNGKRSTISLHRWILNKPKNLTVDHIDRDTLNNTRGNLRAITNAQNAQNRQHSKNSKTGLRGVYLNKKLNKYVAQVVINRKRIYLGVYENIEEANKVVIEKRKELMEYCPENGAVFR